MKIICMLIHTCALYNNSNKISLTNWVGKIISEICFRKIRKKTCFLSVLLLSMQQTTIGNMPPGLLDLLTGLLQTPLFHYHLPIQTLSRIYQPVDQIQMKLTKSTVKLTNLPARIYSL